MTVPLRPAPGPRRRLRRPGLSTIVVVLGAVVAVNLLIVAVVVGGDAGRNDGAALPPQIVRLIPPPGTVVPTQESIGAELLVDYTGRLYINGVAIPPDQMEPDRSLGLVVFRPGPGQEFTRLAEGAHRATIVYWPKDPSRQEPERSHSWSFRAG